MEAVFASDGESVTSFHGLLHVVWVLVEDVFQILNDSVFDFRIVDVKVASLVKSHLPVII